MAEQTYEQKYKEQDRLVKQNTAIVQPFLKDFSEQYDLGTEFYSDVTILDGPHSNFFWDTVAGKRLNELYKQEKVSIFYVKLAGGSFIIEYQFDGNRVYNRKNELIQVPNKTPVRTYFLYKGKQTEVEPHIAMAAKDLYWAQKYRGILLDCLDEVRR